ncbi:UNVERIFIED_CONTAM: hypothetical protein PYX00_008411 [Menopon gallinae]|uniref:phospholipase A2 n=1 Tax=Menopon gallinae TaxID=328185 RepID=A0AAW2HN27_9NEOP
MSWFNTLTSNVMSLLTMEYPNKVLDVKVEEYSQKAIYLREDSLVLYAPNSANEKYDLVLHRPYNETLYEAYSLCRCPTVEMAENKFILFKDKVPMFVSVCKDVCNSASIQKICDLIVEHPTWTIAHLVTHLGYSDCLTEPGIAKFINSEDWGTGLSPLQLAIQDLNVKMVQALINNNASLDHFDNELNSVLHYAASTNKQIINLLCEKSKNTLNSKNKRGYTPLHRACLSDKPECVRALLQAGADVNITATQKETNAVPRKLELSSQNLAQKLFEEDMKYGGTPLHWACSSEVVEDLISKNCDINIPNFDSRTALHVMVLRDRLECLVALLSNNADCNIGDKDGNTPLHLAVQEGREAMVQALIVFGADMAYTNNAGHYPRHRIACESSPGDKILYLLHAAGAPRCPPDQDGCNTGCKHGEEFNGVPPPTPRSAPSRDFLNHLLDAARIPPSDEAKGRLLCLDGGGIRGLVLVSILIELEKKLGKPIISCFDWVAATSTGGILALALACGKTLQECLCLYFKMKNTVFTGTRPYASEPFENILKNTFGEKETMASIPKPRLMITAVMADRVPVDLVLFRNYPSPSEILGVAPEGYFQPSPAPEEQLIWHAARATGAAPTYFRSFGRYLDGGLIANNPTMDALTEIREFEMAVKSTDSNEPFRPLAMVVSVGTGSVPLVSLNGEMDVFRPDHFWEYGKLMKGISTLTLVIVDQATQSDGRVVDRARAWCSSLGISYFRFSPQLSENISMDERADKKLVNMLWETKAYMHSKSSEVDELVRLLAG